PQRQETDLTMTKNSSGKNHPVFQRAVRQQGGTAVEGCSLRPTDESLVMMCDPSDTTHYWPERAEVQDDGVVVIRVTGRERVGGRWGGIRRFAARSPDYGFWRWVVENKERWPSSFSDADLPAMRAEYERQAGNALSSGGQVVEPSARPDALRSWAVLFDPDRWPQRTQRGVTSQLWLGLKTER